jgi:hypothetical protein
VSFTIDIHIGWHPKRDSLDIPPDFVIKSLTCLCKEINWHWCAGSLLKY